MSTPGAGGSSSGNALRPCAHCKTPNNPKSVICKKCGARLPWSATATGNQNLPLPPPPLPPRPPSASASWFAMMNEEGAWVYAIISLLFPIIGAVLYFMSRNEEPFKASMCRSFALAGLMLNMALSQAPRALQQQEARERARNEPPLTIPATVRFDQSAMKINHSVVLWVQGGDFTISHQGPRGAQGRESASRKWEYRFEADASASDADTFSLTAHNQENRVRLYAAIYLDGHRVKLASCDGDGCDASLDYTIPQTEGLSAAPTSVAP